MCLIGCKGGIMEKINIEQNTSNLELVYGLSKELIEQVKMQSNQNLKLTIDDKDINSFMEELTRLIKKS